jgi:hypothetical protein
VHGLRRDRDLPRERPRLPVLPREPVGARALATLLASPPLAVAPAVDPELETRRRARVQSPAVGFVGGILLFAALLAVIVVALWAVL